MASREPCWGCNEHPSRDEWTSAYELESIWNISTRSIYQRARRKGWTKRQHAGFVYYLMSDVIVK